MFNWNDIYKIKSGIVSREIAGENIKVPVMGTVLDMQKIYSLNKIGEFIWQKLDGQNSLAAIATNILDKFDVSREQAESDVLSFVGELSKNGLIDKE